LLHNCGISTSGDTEQAIEIKGVRYSHILDPATGLGLTNRIQVSVIAPNATTTDGLATALCIMGVKRSLRLVDTLPNTAAYVLTKENEETKVFISRRFRQIHPAPIPVP
jgi:thiamine biosynthesis lipoprotein